MKKVCVITGMTATGKSEFSLECAQQFNGEIISADSVAIYKQCTIGSAKIPLKQRRNIAHYLIDELDYRKPYNVKIFQEQARKYIDDIHQRGKLPIIVGGTGMYIKALLYDYQFNTEEEVLSFAGRSNASLYQELLAIDPESTRTIHENNRKRVMRALSIYYTQNKTKSELIKDQTHALCYDANVFIFSREREQMYQAINERVDQMMADGLEQEVRELTINQEAWSYQSMQAIGYREFQAYFNHEISKEACIEQIKQDTRRFAKRQVTWFKHQMPGEWVDSAHIQRDELKEKIKAWLERN